MKKLIVLLVAGFLFTGSSLFAQPSNNPMGMKHKKSFAQGKTFKSPQNHMERMKKVLNLTDAQVQKINDLKFELDNKKLDLVNAIQKNKLLVKKMMSDKKINEKELLRLTKKNSSLKGQLSENRIKMWIDVYNLLDDTQKDKWIDMFSHFANKMKQGKMHKKGMPGMPPKF